MREFAEEISACRFCGAREPNPCGEGVVYSGGEGATFYRTPESVSPSASPGRVPRERSGLAYAAGFAGVLYLFRYSFAPLVASQWGLVWSLGVALIFLWSLLAPLALLLGFAAGVSLDRAPEKSGKLPALFGLFVGWFGTVSWLFLLDGLWRGLMGLR